MERRSVLASALLAFMVLGGCTGATHALTGEVSFLGTPIGLDCLGNSTLAGSLPGVHDGSEVVVEDATHAVVGTAALIPLPGSGRKPGPTYFEGVGLCDFSFTVTDIPDSKFYSITIGGLPGPTYSSDQLQSMNWTVVLGNPPTDVAPVQSELPATQTPTPAATPQPVYGLNQAITLPGYSRIGPDPNDYTPTNFVTIDAAQLTVIAEETWKGKAGMPCQLLDVLGRVVGSGCSYLTAEIHIKVVPSLGPYGGTFNAPDYYDVVGADGTKVNADQYVAYYDRDPPLLPDAMSSIMAEGASATGWLTFQVPRGFVLDHLEVTPSAGEGPPTAPLIIKP